MSRVGAGVTTTTTVPRWVEVATSAGWAVGEEALEVEDDSGLLDPHPMV